MLMNEGGPGFWDWPFPKDMPPKERKRIKADCHYKIHQALKKGTIKKPNPPCPVCLSKIGLMVSHHFDYGKPLEVFWCCNSCHFKHHHRPEFYIRYYPGSPAWADHINELRELHKAAYAEPGGEAFKKLFLYPWPVVDASDRQPGWTPPFKIKQKEDLEKEREGEEDGRTQQEITENYPGWIENCPLGLLVFGQTQNRDATWEDAKKHWKGGIT